MRMTSLNMAAAIAVSAVKDAPRKKITTISLPELDPEFLELFKMLEDEKHKIITIGSMSSELTGKAGSIIVDDPYSSIPSYLGEQLNDGHIPSMMRGHRKPHLTNRFLMSLVGTPDHFTSTKPLTKRQKRRLKGKS